MRVTINNKIQSVLTTFQNLSADDKAIALRLLEQNQNSYTSNAQLSLTPSENLLFKAHTCSLCQDLVLNWGTDYPPYVRYQGSLHFSKEDLVQGLAQQCLLVEWLLNELERSLFQFKSRLGSEGLTPTPSRCQRRPPGPLDNLDYIHAARGLDCTVTLKFLRGGGTVANMSLYFTLNPLLMDRLYRTSHYSEQNDFQKFYSKSLNPGAAAGYPEKTYHVVAAEGKNYFLLIHSLYSASLVMARTTFSTLSMSVFEFMSLLTQV